jgi:tetratricopeptide (TPR) repeat protein
MGRGYMRMARLLKKESREDEAVDVLREAVQHSPQDAGLRLMLASALGRAGATTESHAEYARAIDLKPEMWVAHYQLGRSFMKAGNAAAARDCLARAAAIAPDKAPVQRALAQAQAALGDHGRAARTYDEAHRLKPSSLRIAVQAAQSKSEAGRHAEALQMLLGLGRMSLRSGLVQKALGDIYMAMDRPAEAVDSYRAMILNAAKLRESAPEVVELASGDTPADLRGFAQNLRAAIETQSQAVAETIRANPKLLRDRLAARRERMAG